jgi:cell division protein FtsL
MNKKSKMLLGLIIAIIAILLVGIVYQFVCIKKLQRKIDEYENAQIVANIENL